MNETLDFHALSPATTPGVQFENGEGGLPRLLVTSPQGDAAEIYLHGAHVTRYQAAGQRPLLFMSAASRFEAGKPIRGGIPLIFPWFGPREGLPAHGVARTQSWTLGAITFPPACGSVRVTLHLEGPAAAGFPAFAADYTITVGATLGLELAVTNRAPAGELIFEDCLHTYFLISDIDQIAIQGLSGGEYLDKVGGAVLRRENEPAIRIASEVDRVYLDTTGTVTIRDAAWRRTIRVAKTGSASTVVWNPWIAKSRQMADFGDMEYPGMVCVESGNVGRNQHRLAPGATSHLQVQLSAEPLAD